MRQNLIKWAALPVFAAVVAGCGSEQKDSDAASVPTGQPAAQATGAVAGGSDLWWRNETYRELDGDEENAERLVATVSKGPLDSTMVRLEIRTSKDRILYRHEWPAVSYMKYGDAGSASDSVAVLRETERQVARLFRDSAFIRGADAPGYTGNADADFDAIRHDIAEHEYRTANSLKVWEPLPRGARAEIGELARTVLPARIQAVGAETRAMPAFKYYAGGEETYVIAWSPSEGRIVRIAACC